MRDLIRIDDPQDGRIAGFVAIKERDLTGRQGRFIAEALLLLENRVAGLGELIEAFPPETPFYVASTAVFDAIAGFNMHRGILALGTRSDAPAMDALIDALPDHCLVVAACGISNHDNIGAIFRNAAAFGASAVLLDETSCDPMYRKAIRVSVGSVLTVPFARDGAVDALVSRLAVRGFAVWGLSPRGAVEIGDIPASKRTALLLGTEGEGLPAGLLASIRTARIAQAGAFGHLPALDSLNVATAAGIALHHAARINGFV